MVVAIMLAMALSVLQACKLRIEVPEGGFVMSSSGRFDCVPAQTAAFRVTSVALRDALLAVDIPFIEIHLSNVFAREAFRHKSYLSDIAAGCIFGLGAFGYEMALQAATRLLSEEK